MTNPEPELDQASIPIPDVGSEITAAMNEFHKKHESSDEEVRAEAMNELKSFIERQDNTTETLLVLAKYAYDVNSVDLLGMFCQRVMDAIKDKKAEEVRETFTDSGATTKAPEEETAISAP
ncbi:SKP1-like protein 16 [Bidens hawaiensis]|uniref:SKP1-like protein 16 n=1 Tax=Bidens hawaiensis TaxID=980011 RepID=UPI0040490F5E